ncbi:endoplasmic oxidoreductin-1 [Thecaphora frezii]
MPNASCSSLGRAGLASRRQLVRCSFPLLLLLVLACLSVASSTAAAAADTPALFRDADSSDTRGAEFLQQVLTAQPKSLQQQQHGRTLGSSIRSDLFASENICKPTGKIEDASCDFETVESINSQFFDRIDSLRKTGFFRYYKVDLFKECPYWYENGLCMNQACSVETADESEIPEEFRTKRLSAVTTAAPSEAAAGGPESQCSCSSTEFCHLDDENSLEAVYVDLLKNPERFTGYAGPSANRVWKSIYEENCFEGVRFIEPARPVSSGGSGFIDKSLLSGKSSLLGGPSGLNSLVASLQAPADSGENEQCLEKRVFYRIISGLHASISIHICHEFLDQKTGQWSPNLECFISRIAEHPERLQNVYFDYVLLMRALSRLGDSTEGFSLQLGDRIRDSETVRQLDQVIHSARECPSTFDEARMFSGETRESFELKQQFRQHFRNISSIMDCVGCDKCRLWGKLQVNGIGTALKLLFNGNEAGEKRPVQLRRSELVALVNAAHRVAESLRAVETFREMYQQERKLALEQKAAAAERKRPKGKPANPSTVTSEAVTTAAPQQQQQQQSQQQHHEAVSSPISVAHRRHSGPSSPANKSGASKARQTAAAPAANKKTLTEQAQLWLESAEHWLAARFEHGVEGCQRSLKHCLRRLGVRAPEGRNHPSKSEL